MHHIDLWVLMFINNLNCIIEILKKITTIIFQIIGIMIGIWAIVWLINIMELIPRFTNSIQVIVEFIAKN